MADKLTTDPRRTPVERMTCMEVWGGNREADQRFQTAGLDVALRSRVYEQQSEGGDIYLISSCASGRITRALLADVSGHGSLVASVAEQLRELIRSNVNVVSQQRLVGEVNRGFSELAKDGGFATAVVCTFFAPTRSLTIANAGHPPPFLYRVNSGTWSPLTDNAINEPSLANTPLGVAKEATYSSPKMNLEVGDMVFCYSDAFIESCNREGAMLGVAGLQELLNDCRPGADLDVLERLEHNIVSLRGENLQDDDATAMLFRVAIRGTTWRDNLLAPLRLFRKAHDNTRFEFVADRG